MRHEFRQFVVAALIHEAQPDPVGAAEPVIDSEFIERAAKIERAPVLDIGFVVEASADFIHAVAAYRKAVGVGALDHSVDGN